MHMSWISGNLNELEGPIAKVNSWYVCGCLTNSWQGVGCIWSLYGLCMIAQAAGHFTIPLRQSQVSFPCDVAEKAI